MHAEGIPLANLCLVTLLTWNNDRNLKDSACNMFKNAQFQKEIDWQ